MCWTPQSFFYVCYKNDWNFILFMNKYQTWRINEKVFSCLTLENMLRFMPFPRMPIMKLMTVYSLFRSFKPRTWPRSIYYRFMHFVSPIKFTSCRNIETFSFYSIFGDLMATTLNSSRICWHFLEFRLHFLH